MHATHHSSPRPSSPLRLVSGTGAQSYPAAQFANRRAWLRAAKSALRLAFQSRSAGGEKLAVIASALGVNDAKASRVLSDAYPDWISDDVHLARLEVFGFAHVAEAVRAVKLGVAGVEARAA